ncbi:hypothetical protein [Hydrogenovibrio kuenenii]|uniref:hypothetical protein n=1 Tax=Hydrogenovibrio kuenenii TaxID=63658 RepID=UPI000465A609|nr:hypothetical protein [Hydrogenovibrio kuenenii]
MPYSLLSSQISKKFSFCLGISISILSISAADAANKTGDNCGFPSYQDTISSNYQGQLFQLSDHYPKEFPNTSKPWENWNFKSDPQAYLNKIKAYIFAGMKEADWRPGQNKVHHWYHMPWVTMGRRAREGVRGLNRNADTKPYELAPTQSKPQQKWELSFYNNYAAYQIGQIWCHKGKTGLKVGEPDLTKTEFPEGSFIAKFVFITGTDKQLPFMKGAPTVLANINETIDRKSPKKVLPVRLVQIDFSIRDKRADSTTSWIMGAFVYDSNAKQGKNGIWDKMVPLGVQWGNDPTITPTMVKNGTKLKESVIMGKIPDYARRRLGYGSRLNGPLDFYGFSCLGCHSMAQWPKPLAKIPKGKTEAEKMHYFRNLKPDEPFQKGHISLDYQLHLENAFRNYFRNDQSAQADD